jgi:hypothetical protein
MFGKLLCWLGIHDWELTYEDGPRLERRCGRCGTHQHTSCNLTTGAVVWLSGQWWTSLARLRFRRFPLIEDNSVKDVELVGGVDWGTGNVEVVQVIRTLNLHREVEVIPKTEERFLADVQEIQDNLRTGLESDE